jgi:hypothetical protein
VSIFFFLVYDRVLHRELSLNTSRFVAVLFYFEFGITRAGRPEFCEYRPTCCRRPTPVIGLSLLTELAEAKMEQESESFDADEAPVIQPGVSATSGIPGLGPSAASGGAPVVGSPGTYTAHVK